MILYASMFQNFQIHDIMFHKNVYWGTSERIIPWCMESFNILKLGLLYYNLVLSFLFKIDQLDLLDLE